MPGNNKVEIIEYSRPLDISFSISHALGAVFGAFALALCLKTTAGSGNTVLIFSCAVYCLAFTAVYGISAFYHGLPSGKAKAAARRLDHMAIPLLLAGTATPCALITLYRLSPAHGIAVFCVGWFCAAFGIVTKLFFFNNEKLKAICMAIYFVGGAYMLFSAVPKLGQINKTAFLLLFIGCVLYSLGAIFCRLGIKRPVMHLPFHILVLAGSIVQFYAIYHYIVLPEV